MSKRMSILSIPLLGMTVVNVIPSFGFRLSTGRVKHPPAAIPAPHTTRPATNPRSMTLCMFAPSGRAPTHGPCLHENAGKHAPSTIRSRNDVGGAGSTVGDAPSHLPHSHPMSTETMPSPLTATWDWSYGLRALPLTKIEELYTKSKRDQW